MTKTRIHDHKMGFRFYKLVFFFLAIQVITLISFVNGETKLLVFEFLFGSIISYLFFLRSSQIYFYDTFLIIRYPLKFKRTKIAYSSIKGISFKKGNANNLLEIIYKNNNREKQKRCDFIWQHYKESDKIDEIFNYILSLPPETRRYQNS